MRRHRTLQRKRAAREERDELEQAPKRRQAKGPGSAFLAGLSALRGAELRGLSPSATEALQRRLSNSALQRMADEGSFSVDPQTERVLESERGRGEPLDEPARKQMANAFGTGLKGVRVHTDATAAALSRGMSARAFTHGRDVYFSAGEYQPGTRDGQRILAHELTHVLQQGDGAKLVVGPANDPAELQADAIAERVVNTVGIQEKSRARRDPEPQHEYQNTPRIFPGWQGVTQAVAMGDGAQEAIQTKPEASKIEVDCAVDLVPQPTNVSCWAASLAMVVATRDGASTTADEVATKAGMSTTKGYNWTAIQGAVSTWGLAELAPMSAYPSYWAKQLKGNGPLWVVEVGAPYHAVVVGGMQGDGSAKGTKVKIYNPWPPNKGKVEDKGFLAFDKEFGLGAGSKANIVHA